MYPNGACPVTPRVYLDNLFFTGCSVCQLETKEQPTEAVMWKCCDSLEQGLVRMVYITLCNILTADVQR